jgi:hypothetical protein
MLFNLIKHLLSQRSLKLPKSKKSTIPKTMKINPFSFPKIYLKRITSSIPFRKHFRYNRSIMKRLMKVSKNMNQIMKRIRLAEPAIIITLSRIRQSSHTLLKHPDRIRRILFLRQITSIIRKIIIFIVPLRKSHKSIKFKIISPNS